MCLVHPGIKSTSMTSQEGSKYELLTEDVTSISIPNAYERSRDFSLHPKQILGYVGELGELGELGEGEGEFFEYDQAHR